MKYPIALRAVINDNISDRFYGGIHMPISKPVRVITKNLTGYCLKLNVVFNITQHNCIVAVYTYSLLSPTLFEQVLYKMKYCYNKVMLFLVKQIST